MGPGCILSLYKKWDSTSFHTVEHSQSFAIVPNRKQFQVLIISVIFLNGDVFLSLELTNIYHGFTNPYPEGIIFHLSPVEQVV